MKEPVAEEETLWITSISRWQILTQEIQSTTASLKSLNPLTTPTSPCLTITTWLRPRLTRDLWPPSITSTSRNPTGNQTPTRFTTQSMACQVPLPRKCHSMTRPHTPGMPSSSKSPSTKWNRSSCRIGSHSYSLKRREFLRKSTTRAGKLSKF